MSLKLSLEEARQKLEVRRAEDRRALEAKHKAETQDLEDKYSAKLQLLHEIWPESSADNPTPPSESEPKIDVMPRDGAVGSNGSTTNLFPDTSRRYIVGKRSVSDEVQIILEEMRGVVADDEIVTTVPVRERYVEKYPGTDNVNLRSRISHILKQASEGDGPLELIEKGVGSEPSKYRFRKKQGEAGPLEP